MGLLKRKVQDIFNYSQTESVYYTLAKYMLVNIHSFHKMSVSKVMEETLVSKTSILKFCNLLGYDSWKSFNVDLHKEQLNEKLRIDNLKMNSKLLYPKTSIDSKYNELQNEYLLEFSKVVTSDMLDGFIKHIDCCDTILLLGDSNEIYAFTELQAILLNYNKTMVFPKMLNKKDFNKQIEKVNQNTLIVFIYSTLSWGGLKEHYTLYPIFDFESLLETKANFIFIGQRDFEGGDEYISQISLPFSFNEYFIRLALQELVYRVIQIYIRSH